MSLDTDDLHQCAECGTTVQACASIHRHTKRACCWACDHEEGDE